MKEDKTDPKSLTNDGKILDSEFLASEVWLFAVFMESFSLVLILHEVQLAFGYDFYKAAQLLSPSKIDVDLLPLAFTQKVGINSG